MAELQSLRLYNTLTRRKEEFVPLDAQNVRMYVCGPTVYDYAHIGNARPVIVFDVLFRLLRHVYGADHVKYVRNITDVDDKINARAADEGISIRELTERTAKQFHEDIAALGVLPPTVEPRATEHIEEMKTLIEALIANGHAYAAEGHVLFDVPSMPDYGKLSNRTLDEMAAGARVEVAPYKKDPMDFVLWKPSKPGEPSWPSPAGIAEPGRPGWHIECSAMAGKHLGDVFDIHGGGIDLVFPHHENEIAQSRCAHGSQVMARYWLHNGFLQVEGEKMSKSLGNFITIHDLLQEWSGEVVRFNMLRTHYRQPIDWTRKALEESKATLDRWGEISDRIGGALQKDCMPDGAVLDALKDDLNTPLAIARLHELAKDARSGDSASGEKWLASAALMGFDVARWHAPVQSADLVEVTDPDLAVRVNTLVAQRGEARKAKNFKEADRIRDELAASGVILKDAKDTATGEIVTTWELAR
ncbi:cysteine--tRNA ligase [Hyphomicrobium sulfonivorans]|uniref:cysteine--tRNA ligase n=1 Tax=Hyphomicrobium sulfonivorans TaxID=121290 RepID=UPI00157002C4|nr:cysteine--tRNA ligase [Hyphomicrobium sulfonivorans]MBI1650353.1 cysteine--tRNA ligase [Hyphomicrobium sulfonivorans]NSL72282.1 cysteine--tRNA ligase [Hyphomicrobium sulfonivorans]